jgi:hypothetical protein
LVFSIAVASEATPMQGSAICAPATIAPIVETDISYRFNSPQNNGTDDLGSGCCNCLACGAVIQNHIVSIKTVLRKTSNIKWFETVNVSGDSPHQPFRPPRI